MLVTGGPPVRGGGGIPQRIRVISVPASVLRITGAGESGNTPGRGEVADIAVDDAEQRSDGGLVGGD